MNWRPYAQLARLPAIFTAFADILATHFIALGGEVLWPVLLLLMLASGLIYSAGMVLNDCFDYDIDARERPSRPLPSGAISRTFAWRWGFAMLIAGVLIAFLASATSGIAALVLAGLVLSYDGWAKNGPLGPLIMGLCRYANWILGLSVIGLASNNWYLPIPMLLYVIGVTILSGQEVEARQRSMVALAAIMAAGSFLAFALLIYLEVLTQPWALIAALVGIALALKSYWTAYQSFRPDVVMKSMRTLLMGIIPLNAIMVLVGGPLWAAVLVVLLLIPGRMLGKRMYIT